MLLASVKYIFTLPYAMFIGIEYKHAILAVLGGGIGGFLFFFYLGRPVNKGLQLLGLRFCSLIPPGMRRKNKMVCEKTANTKQSKLFSKKNRYIVRLKSSYGFWGIIVATPVILTIPIGAFLANKYYGRRKHIVTYMIISIVGWALVLSGFIQLFPKVFH